MVNKFISIPNLRIGDKYVTLNESTKVKYE